VLEHRNTLDVVSTEYLLACDNAMSVTAVEVNQADALCGTMLEDAA
jgi:hypothetical protein